MLKQALLAIEILALCGPATTLLFTGLLYSPAFLLAGTSGRGDWSVGAFMILSGLWGFISLANLALHSVSKKRQWPGRPMQWFGIAMGLLSCLIGLATMGKDATMAFIFSGPIITAIHLSWLSRFRRSI